MSSTILVTGAGGEIGHGLMKALASNEAYDLVTLDLKGVDGSDAMPGVHYTGDVLDTGLIASIFADHLIDGVIHLAAMLSSSGERNPERAFDVNVNGTMNLLRAGRASAERRGEDLLFLFPSTIAVYGLPDLETKKQAGKVSEDDYLSPITMYGVNKLSCEHVGRYYTRHFGALLDVPSTGGIDFRGLRFPGLISSETVPSGGTSDFLPEMLHAAAAGRPYACFARPDTQIPFMTMPDAVSSILDLCAADRSRLTRTVYNVGAFAPTALEIAERLEGIFEGTEITWEVDERRQRFLDTWPADVDDSAARTDWGYAPEHTLDRAFEEYLLPALDA